MPRCSWATNELLNEYHDHEWGVPVHDDQLLFEFVILEGAQAGLSWHTILQKREAYRKAFHQFRAKKIAAYDQQKIQELRNNPGIVRNRLKILATVNNAKAFGEVQKEYGTFDSFMWQFVGGATIQNRWKTLQEIPCHTPESDAMSHALRQRGFSFVGTKICYALMQATGMVNDHTVDCFRYRQLRANTS